MATWTEITEDPRYQALSYDEKHDALDRYAAKKNDYYESLDGYDPRVHGKDLSDKLDVARSAIEKGTGEAIGGFVEDTTKSATLGILSTGHALVEEAATGIKKALPGTEPSEERDVEDLARVNFEGKIQKYWQSFKEFVTDPVAVERLTGHSGLPGTMTSPAFGETTKKEAAVSEIESLRQSLSSRLKSRDWDSIEEYRSFVEDTTDRMMAVGSALHGDDPSSYDDRRIINNKENQALLSAFNKTRNDKFLVALSHNLTRSNVAQKADDRFDKAAQKAIEDEKASDFTVEYSQYSDPIEAVSTAVELAVSGGAGTALRKGVGAGTKALKVGRAVGVNAITEAATEYIQEVGENPFATDEEKAAAVKSALGQSVFISTLGIGGGAMVNRFKERSERLKEAKELESLKKTEVETEAIKEPVSDGIEQEVISPELQETIGKIVEEQETVALNKDEIATVRDARGEQEITPSEKVTLDQQLTKAKEQGLEKRADALAEEIINDPRVITPEEHAGMVIRAGEIFNQRDAALTEAVQAQESGNVESQKKARELSFKLEQQADLLERAATISGSEASRALGIRKLRLKRDDFSLASMEQRARVAKGEALNEKELSEVNKLSTQIREQQEIITKLQKEIKDIGEGQIPADLKKKMMDAAVMEVQGKREFNKKVNRFGNKRSFNERTLPRKAMNVGVEALLLSRALLATGDFSATFRQGLPLVTRQPKEAVKSFGKAFKSFFSQDVADAIDIQLKGMDEQASRDEAGLYLASMDRIDLAAREENFATDWAERIPGVRQLVLASERNMVTFLNLMRVARYDKFVSDHPDASLQERQAFASYVNAASGRGSLGIAERAAKELSVVFFAPRFAASRFQAPLKLVSNWNNPVVRNAVAGDLGRLMGTGFGVLGMGLLAGWEVGTDPEESDWGKIIIGNTRIDIWGGFQQPVRLMMKPAIMLKDRVVEGETDIDLSRALFQFAEFKFAPAISAPMEILQGEDVIGRDVDIMDTVIESYMPLFIQEGFEVATGGRGVGDIPEMAIDMDFDIDGSDALKGLAAAGLAGLGVGVGEQSPREDKKKSKPTF